MIETIKSTFNNREISIFIWTILFIVWILGQKSFRSDIIQVLKSFSKTGILIIFLSMLCYISLIVLLLNKSGLWDVSLLKDTIYWTFGVAFILLVNINKATEKDGFFKQTVLKNLKFIIILEFIINLYTFSFVVEFLVMPIIVFLTIVNVYSERDKKNQQSTKVLTSGLAIFGLVVLSFSVGKMLNDFDNFMSVRNLKTFLLSPIFTLAFIPFLYVTALFLVYEVLFVRIKFLLKEKHNLVNFMLWRILLICNINLKRVKLVSKELKILFIKDESDFSKVLKNIIKEKKHIIPDTHFDE